MAHWNIELPSELKIPQTQTITEMLKICTREGGGLCDPNLTKGRRPVSLFDKKVSLTTPDI